MLLGFAGFLYIGLDHPSTGRSGCRVGLTGLLEMFCECLFHMTYGRRLHIERGCGILRDALPSSLMSAMSDWRVYSSSSHERRTLLDLETTVAALLYGIECVLYYFSQICHVV